MVHNVASWAKLMVLLYEKKSKQPTKNTVYFKLAIDVRCHWTQGGHVLLLPLKSSFQITTITIHETF